MTIITGTADFQQMFQNQLYEVVQLNGLNYIMPIVKLSSDSVIMTSSSSSICIDGLMIYQNGVPLGTGTAIDFQSNLTAIISGSVIFLSSAGGGGNGTNGIMAWDEGVPLGTGTIINFVGDNVIASISGSVIQVYVTGSASSVNPPVTGSIVFWDEGILQGSATTLNVVSDIADISVSGGVARLFITGSASGLADHESLTGLLGGQPGEHYHLSNSQYTGLVSGTYTSLHDHYFTGGVHGDIWTRNTGTVQGASFVNQDFNIQWTLGDGMGIVPSGSTNAGYGYIDVPVDCIVEGWTLLADQTGTVTINILQSTYAAFPPTNSLAGLGQPVLSSQRKNTQNATGTASLSKTDVLLVHVASVPTNVRLLTVSLLCRKVALS